MVVGSNVDARNARFPNLKPISVAHVSAFAAAKHAMAAGRWPLIPSAKCNAQNAAPAPPLQTTCQPFRGSCLFCLRDGSIPSADDVLKKMRRAIVAAQPPPSHTIEPTTNAATAPLIVSQPTKKPAMQIAAAAETPITLEGYFQRLAGRILR